MANPIEAMILAAGRGRRMQPYTSETPKPLVKVGGHPLIDYALKLVQHAGIEEAIVNTHHLGEQIEGYLAKQNFTCTISREEELLETGGGICRALPLLGSSFFTLNSDVICVEESNSSVLKKMNEAWDASHMDGLMLLCPLERAVGYKGAGDFSLAEDGRIQPRVEGKSAYVYMGIQRLHKRFLDGAPKGAFSLSQLYKAAVNKGENCPLYGMVHEGAWLHVGDAQGIELAENYLSELI
ncbi:MAG: nucleotidyltransferase family protein [Rickettsiales bacterium]|nr:nucleotidyltransferase family protein [Rickettsiales bacterium]